MNDPEDEGRIARWSRRKRKARDGGNDALAEEPITHPIDPASESDDADLSEEELLEKYELPDPETLKAGDDFSAFMRQGVPDILRRKALRVLWKSNPALANLDGLIDYGEDFTDAAVVPETIATVYQVGKGIVRDALARDEAPADDDVSDASEGSIEDLEELVEEPVDELAEELAEQPIVQPTVSGEKPDEPGNISTELGTADASNPRPKRMKFLDTS